MLLCSACSELGWGLGSRVLVSLAKEGGVFRSTAAWRPKVHRDSGLKLGVDGRLTTHGLSSNCEPCMWLRTPLSDIFITVILN